MQSAVQDHVRDDKPPESPGFRLMFAVQFLNEGEATPDVRAIAQQLDSHAVRTFGVI